MNAGEVTNLVMNILTIVSILGGITIGFRRWIKKWIREVSRQLETSNGHTVGQYTEKTSKDVEKLEARLQNSDLLELRLKRLEERIEFLLPEDKNKAA